MSPDLDDFDEDERPLFEALRRAQLNWVAGLEHPKHPDCTGLGAEFCDVHGVCTCLTDSNGYPNYDTPGCPLHWSTVVCSACSQPLAGPNVQDQIDLSKLRYRRVLCRKCFDAARRT